MSVATILEQFHQIATNPGAQKKKYLDQGKKVVLMAPVYTPEEIIHSMGCVPIAAWGADIELHESKRYFPAFICSIMQSIVELGMKGTYDGVSAIVIPSLCDSLKVLGENWKYAVPSIPFIPMTYPQNRKPTYGEEFTRAGYRKVIGLLEEATGITFADEKLAESIKVYNEHNQVMRDVEEVLAGHSEITASQRNDIFKSAGFMLKEEHTALAKELLEELRKAPETADKIKIMTTGILADSPSLLSIIEENDFQIVCDDVAAESRQYRTDAPEAETALDSLAKKFCQMDNCSILYDVEKKRVQMIADQAKKYGAKGVVLILTKFCDPEEFDYPLIRRACVAEGIPVLLIEVDRQMTDYAQARTMLEGFRDMLAC
ncbi:MAG: 2-hydroxyacyl-CoA dehydratase family protein [Clostridiales bacterium]|nr:2-hydroxyacyl-CoA dehydratase family protein [Clostridiales bacterium]